MQVKHLEQALTDLAGPNWKGLSFPPRMVVEGRRSDERGFLEQNNIAIPVLSTGRLDSPTRPASRSAHSKDRSSGSGPGANANQQQSEQQRKSIEGTIAQIEQIKLMILGMDQRLESREAEIAANIKRAQGESNRFEEMRKQVLSATNS